MVFSGLNDFKISGSEKFVQSSENQRILIFLVAALVFPDKKAAKDRKTKSEIRKTFEQYFFEVQIESAFNLDFRRNRQLCQNNNWLLGVQVEWDCLPGCGC